MHQAISSSIRPLLLAAYRALEHAPGDLILDTPFNAGSLQSNAGDSIPKPNAGGVLQERMAAGAVPQRAAEGLLLIAEAPHRDHRLGGPQVQTGDLLPTVSARSRGEGRLCASAPS